MVITLAILVKKTYTPHIKIELFLQKIIIAENFPVLQHFQKPLGANQKKVGHILKKVRPFSKYVPCFFAPS